MLDTKLRLLSFGCSWAALFDTVQSLTWTVDSREQELKKINILVDSLEVPQLDARQKAIKGPESGTFKWILRQSESEHRRQTGSLFKEWLQRGDLHTIFWISGKPASGKSTLMKHIHTDERDRLCELLGQWTQGPPPIIAGFYFSAESHTPSGKTQEGFLRALLHQILPQLPEESRTRVLRAKYDTQDWSMGAFTKPSAVSWTLNELQQLFHLITVEAQQGQYIYIYADGLDEYYQLDSLGNIINIDDSSDDHADARLEGQSEIAQLFLKHAGNPYLKMCISSRSQPPFEDIFANITGAGLRFRMENLTRPDISSLVHGRLKNDENLVRLEKSQPGFREELLKDVIEKAHGVFTWVDLITRRLRTMLSGGDRIPEILEYMNCVPSQLGGPSGLYMSLLKGITTRHRLEAARLFNAVITTVNPMTAVTLSYCEVEPEEAVKERVQQRSSQELYSEALTMSRRIWSRCAGLLEVQPMSTHEAASSPSEGHIELAPKVSFIHLTVREFLRSPEIWNSLVGNGTLVNPNVTLLVSSLLRLKRIGVTFYSEDVWGAVYDAVRYAKQVEQETGTCYGSLLDNLDSTMSQLVKEQWSHADAHDIKHKMHLDNEHAGEYHWMALAYKSLRCIHTDFLSFGIWGSLSLYLESKETLIEKRIEKEKTVSDHPLLLTCAVAPKESLFWRQYGYHRPGLNQASARVVRLLLKSGADPNERRGGKTVWEMMLRWKSIARRTRHDNIDSPCDHDTNFMDIMTVMLEHGANPNAVGTHNCSLLFMAATCADLPIDRRKDLIHLLLTKGAELFPEEPAKLSMVPAWADVSACPVLDEDSYIILLAEGADSERFKSRRATKRCSVM